MCNTYLKLTIVEVTPFEAGFFPETIRSAVCYSLESMSDAYVDVMIANQRY